jgi:acyl-CoA thioesterase-1
MLNAIALWFASGAPLYWGLGIGQAACVIALDPEWRRGRFALDVLALLGIVLVVLSAAPLPWSFYVVWIVAVLALRANARYGKRPYGPLAQGLILLSGGALVVMVSHEYGYRKIPQLALTDTKVLYVIGDSLSIGADKQELNWPELTGAQIGAAVHNYSSGGATVTSAVSSAKRLDDSASFVLLEIGGNDLLKGTDPEVFAENLETLLGTVYGSNRELAMFELPLPPFHNAYGRIQREKAARYGVTLIPKRFFARVLASEGATLDGLHFSHTGHERMAEEVAELFRPKKVQKMSWEGF